MGESEVITYLSSIPVGTIIAWVLVIGTILTTVTATVKKIYKMFESAYKTRTDSDALKKMVQDHESQLVQINEKLTRIQETLDKQDENDLKKMRHTIVRTGEEAILKGEISIRSFKSLEELYEVYHDEKHGNGYVTSLMKKVRNNVRIVGSLDEDDDASSPTCV